MRRVEMRADAGRGGGDSGGASGPALRLGGAGSATAFKPSVIATAASGGADSGRDKDTPKAAGAATRC